MSKVKFDEINGFEKNLDEFLLHMEKIDRDMGKILRDNVSKLKLADDERSRKEARERFNTNILVALDELEEKVSNNE